MSEEINFDRFEGFQRIMIKNALGNNRLVLRYLPLLFALENFAKKDRGKFEMRTFDAEVQRLSENIYTVAERSSMNVYKIKLLEQLIAANMIVGTGLATNADQTKPLASFLTYQFTPLGMARFQNATVCYWYDEMLNEEAAKKTQIETENALRVSQIELNKNQKRSNIIIAVGSSVAVVLSIFSLVYSVKGYNELNAQTSTGVKQYKLDSSASEPKIAPVINVSIDSVIVKQSAPIKNKKK